MNKKQHEIHRKLRILHYAENTGYIEKTCRFSALVEAVFIDAGCLSQVKVKQA